MPQAATTATTSRRALLLAGSGGLLGGAAARADADAELVRAVELALSTDRRASALTVDLVGEVPCEIEARQCVLFDKVEALVEEVARTPARSIAGLAAKGRLLRRFMPLITPAGDLAEEAGCEERVAFSLTADLIRLDGAR